MHYDWIHNAKVQRLCILDRHMQLVERQNSMVQVVCLMEKVESASTFGNTILQLATLIVVARQVTFEGVVIRATSLCNLQCNNVA